MRKILVSLIVFFTSFLMATSYAGAKDSSGLHSWAYDGKFGFAINSVQCGQKSITANYVTRTAQGVFCVVGISIKNTSDKAQIPDDSAQFLYDIKGRQYSADTSADVYLNTSSIWSLSNGLNPGLTSSGFIYFDVPANTIIASMKVHDSAFSNGATITLLGANLGPWVKDKIVNGLAAINVLPEIMNSNCADGEGSPFFIGPNTRLIINGDGGAPLVNSAFGVGKNTTEKVSSKKTVKACLYTVHVWLPINQAMYYYKSSTNSANISFSHKTLMTVIAGHNSLNFQLTK